MTIINDPIKPGTKWPTSHRKFLGFEYTRINGVAQLTFCGLAVMLRVGSHRKILGVAV